MAVYSNLFTNPQPISSTGWGTTPGASGVTSPSVITNAAGPAGNQARRVAWTTGTATALAGQWCGGNAGIAQNVAATPGNVYSVAGYVRSSKAQTMVCRIQWLDAANAQLSVSTGVDVAVAANTWTQVKLENATAPASAVSVRANFYSAASTASPWAAGDTLDVQAGTITEGATLPQPFHGAMADTATEDFAWTGAADASTSTLTEVTAPILAMPTGLTATPISSTQIDVNYTRAVSSTGGEDIERNGSIIVTGYTGSLPYHDTGLTASTLYSYYVRSTN